MCRPKQHNTKSSNGILFAIIGLILATGTVGLLYPANSILQLTASMSVPIDIPDARKVFCDLGFQMNYNLPFDLVAFYNPTIWANAWERRRKRESKNFTGYAQELLEAESGVHPSDFTAGELYAGMERLLQDYGFHRSCLLRSVCELALYPLADSHSYNLLVQVISFLLTPSQHDGFGAHEKLYKHRYERAEKLGFIGTDCQVAYPKCKFDLLSMVTTLVR